MKIYKGAEYIATWNGSEVLIAENYDLANAILELQEKLLELQRELVWKIQETTPQQRDKILMEAKE